MRRTARRHEGHRQGRLRGAALVELAARGGGPAKLQDLTAAQDIPGLFLENVLRDLRAGGLVASQRGAQGGYRLARPAAEITVADGIRVLEGPLANIQGIRPDEAHFPGSAAPMREVWVAMRAALRSVLEAVTIDDVVAGRLPPPLSALMGNDHAWKKR